MYRGDMLRIGEGAGRLVGGLMLGLALVCLLLPAAASAAPERLPAATPHIARVWPGKGRVALTFDGDYFGGRVTEIIATLRRYQVRATFFLTAYYLNTYPTRARQLLAAGQEIASHGYEHRDYRDLSDAAIIRRLDSWEAVYARLSGADHGPAFWRAPYGASNTRVRNAAARAGYQTIYWTLDSLDTVGVPKSANFIYNRLTRSGINLNGAILLLHVNPNGTIEALPRVLATLQARGLDVVSVSGLLAP